MGSPFLRKQRPHGALGPTVSFEMLGGVQMKAHEISKWFLLFSLTKLHLGAVSWQMDSTLCACQRKRLVSRTLRVKDRPGEYIGAQTIDLVLRWKRVRGQFLHEGTSKSVEARRMEGNAADLAEAGQQNKTARDLKCISPMSMSSRILESAQVPRYQ